MPHFQSYLNKRKVVDEKLLEENAKTADQYEIAYVRGGIKEAFHLAFYTLAKTGYLIKSEETDPKHYPPRKYLLDKSKDLSLLHELEKIVALSYDKNTLLPENRKDYQSVLSFIEKWERKIKPLSLQPRALKLWHDLEGVTIFSIIINVIVMGVGFYNIGLIKALLLYWPLIVLTSIEIFVLSATIVKRRTYFETNLNQEKYFELFEKKHFPYPDFREKSFSKYLEMITPCTLG